MHLILDFQDNNFSLQEQEIEKIPKNVIKFFDFYKKEGFLLEKLVKIMTFTIKDYHDLALRGSITQEAKEKIKELLEKSLREVKCI